MTKQEYLEYFPHEDGAFVTCETVLPFAHLEQMAKEFQCTEAEVVQIAFYALSHITCCSPGLLWNLAKHFHGDDCERADEAALLGTIMSAIVMDRYPSP